MKVNKLRTYLPSVFIISLLVSVSFTVPAQERGMTWGERIRTRVGAEVGIPLFSDSSYFNPGFGGFGSVDVAIVPFLSPALQGRIYLLHHPR